MPDILAIGEPLVELAAEEAGPLEQVRRFRRGWGGDTFNCVVSAARLGASAGYQTRVGDDPFGRAFLAFCRDEGIDASPSRIDPTSYTGLYLIAFHGGRHGFTYYRRGSAASHLHPVDIDPDRIAQARVLHTSGITQAISDTAHAAVAEAVEAARRHGVLVSYDANLRPALRPVAFLRAVFEASVPQADVVFMSLDDVVHLYGAVAPEEAGRRVLDLGAGAVVVKQGQDGCLVGSEEEGFATCPPWPVDVVDPSGGGDAFAGAFLVEWALGGASLQDAGRFANAVGALAVAGLGAVAPIPGRRKVEEFIRAGGG
ncbi:MAG TPA: sugar kinase [Actinomycetota bacterium]|nr:sugar kinase [Actinomycetota bacterium]